MEIDFQPAHGCQSLCFALYNWTYSRKMVVPQSSDTLRDPRSQPSPDAGYKWSWKFPTGSWRRAGRCTRLTLSPKWLHPLIDPPASPLVSHECHSYDKKKKNHIPNSSAGTLWAFMSEALIDTAHQRALCQADENRGDCNEIPFVILVKAQNQ